MIIKVLVVTIRYNVLLFFQIGTKIRKCDRGHRFKKAGKN